MDNVGQPLSLSAGVAAYLLYFHHGERNLYPYSIIQVHLLLAFVLFIARQQYLGETLSIAASITLNYSCLYLIGLYGSLLTFRVFLNPLNDIPGPFLARLTKFRHVFQNRTFKGHLILQKQHRKWGNFVRLGPNDISVTDPAAVQVISAPNSKCVKGEWYANDHPLVSMHTARDRGQHDRRRKVWAPAFSPAALKGYEVRLRRYNDLLIEGLQNGKFEQVGKGGDGTGAVNVSEVFNWYSFDVMGDLAFGRSFGCLEGGETHWAVKLLSEGMKPAGLALPGWFFRFIIAIPGATKDYWRFINFCSDQLAKRMKEQPERVKSKGEDKDIAHTLIESYDKMPADDQRRVLPMLQGDSRLIIVAGSDTTAATLVYLFHWLAKDKTMVEKLRKEMDICRESGGFSHQKLIDAELLNGCIYEALRLNPPVPCGIFRKTPKEGVYVGEKFIPGNTTIQMPWYVMGRDENCYEDAESFRPERWFAKNVDKMVKHKDAFQSFNSGPYGCIGKNLALMEVRTVTAQILDHFNVSYGKNEDGSKVMLESIDHFTLGLAPLMIKFSERN